MIQRLWEQTMRYPLRGGTLLIGGWAWVLITGVLLQWWVIPATPWHAGYGLLAGGDWVMFHEQALQLAESIEREGWSAWVLRYEGQAPASLAAAFYVLSGIKEPWVLLPISGMLYAVALVAAVSIGQTLGVKENLTWLIIVPFIFPSSLLIYGQLHKDILSLPGVLLFAWSWVMTFGRQPLQSSRTWKIAAAATVGVLLSWWVRPYQAQLLVAISALLWIFALGTATQQRQWFSLGVKATVVFFCVVSVYLSAEKLTNLTAPAAPAAPAAPPCETWKPEVDLPILGRPIAAIFCYRHGFIRFLSDGNANIDHDRPLTNYVEALAYVPRALQVGVLAPFPVHWWDEASSPGGRVKRLISGLEMVWVYGTLVGLFWVWRYRGIDSAFVSLSIIAIIGILFYVYTSPNVGALYRYRLPFLLLLLIAATAGWSKRINTLDKTRTN